MKEGNVLFHNARERERIFFLFNDALNTFYLRLYGVRHMVKDHSDSEKGNPLPPQRLLLSINSIFHNALNTFFIWHQTYAKGILLPPYGLLIPIKIIGSFIPHTGCLLYQS